MTQDEFKLALAKEKPAAMEKLKKKDFDSRLAIQRKQNVQNLDTKFGVGQGQTKPRHTPQEATDTDAARRKAIMDRLSKGTTTRQQTSQDYLDRFPDQEKYDLLTQQTQAGAGRELLDLERQTKESLRNQGFGPGSMIYESAMNKMRMQHGIGTGDRLTGIRLQQLQESGQRYEAERGRMFGADEKDIDRFIDAEIELGNMNLADKKFVQDALEFSSEMKFKRWAEQNGIDELTAERAWKTSQNVLDRAHEIGIGELEDKYATGRMTLADTLSNNAAAVKMSTDKYYNMGKSQIELSPAQLEGMSDIEKDAYESGKAGRTYEEYSTSRDAAVAYREALILKLDPDSPTFQEDLDALYARLGLPTTTTPGAVPPPPPPGGLTPLGATPAGITINPEGGSQLQWRGSARNQYVTFRAKLNKGDAFNFNGERYILSADPARNEFQEVGGTMADYEKESFIATDPSGAQFKFVAQPDGNISITRLTEAAPKPKTDTSVKPPTDSIDIL